MIERPKPQIFKVLASHVSAQIASYFAKGIEAVSLLLDIPLAVRLSNMTVLIEVSSCFEVVVVFKYC